MVISKKIQTIIWDWNGTLLDDVELCIEIINELLVKRRLPLLKVDKYREVFSFPVKEYYEKIGFDFYKEPFVVPAKEFIDSYNHRVLDCNLQKGAKNILQYFHDSGKQQFILSAMEQVSLEKTLEHHSIIRFFNKVSGLDNYYAASKIENGKMLIEKAGINRDEVCLIGDTVHDFEVAQALGCQCILIADGHQSLQRLKRTGCPVISNLSELFNFLR